MFRACSHELPQFNTTKRTTPTSVATTFPDYFQSVPLATDLSEKTKTVPKWDEALATLSEAAVSLHCLSYHGSKNRPLKGCRL